MRRSIILAGCLAGLTLLAYRSAQTPKKQVRLLDTARVALRYHWKLIDGMSFRWASERNLLVIPYQFEKPVLLHDILTGEEKPLPALTLSLQNPSGGRLLDWSASPPHWAMSATIGSRPDYFQSIHVCNLDSKQQVEWQAPAHCNQASFHWMADNRHWLSLEENPATGNYTRALLGDMQTPRTLTEIPLSDDSPFNQLDHSMNCAVSPQRILSIPGRFYQSNHPAGHLVTLYKISIDGKTVTASLKTIALPERAGMREVAFSADGTKIAWRLRSVFHTPYSTLQPAGIPAALKTASTWREGPARATNSIWISDGEGGHMREIGYIDVPLRENDLDPAIPEPLWTDGGTDEPGSLEWLPGDKYLSLWIKDELYRFPAV